MPRSLVLASAVFFGVALPASAAPVGYTLGNDGTSLLRFNVATPGTVAAVSLQNGVSLSGIDFRPLTGEMFGYSDASDSYYLIDPMTGATALVGSSPATQTTATNLLDIDFNPTIDRMRTVTTDDVNIVFNPNDGSTNRFIDLFYAAGDPNEGVSPSIAGNAYTNSFAANNGVAGNTTQYVLDFNLNTLGILANNAGTITTVGEVTVGGSTLDFGEDVGFDIFSVDGSANIAYAILNADSVSFELFTIDLGTGAAVSLGALPENFGDLYGLAIGPEQVPAPAGLALFGLGVLGLLRARRRA